MTENALDDLMTTINVNNDSDLASHFPVVERPLPRLGFFRLGTRVFGFALEVRVMILLLESELYP